MKNFLIPVLFLPRGTMAVNEAGILKDLIKQFEELASEFAKRVEDMYQDRRCNATDHDACVKANFNGCISTFPGAACNATTELIIEACGSCSSVFDVTISSVLLPPRTVSNIDGTTSLSNEVSNLNIYYQASSIAILSASHTLLSPQVMESICFSRGLDSYFREIREYWLKIGPSDESLKIDPPTMFFGSQTGAFRIFPGRPSSKCSPFSEYSDYDPRRRPWYVAASSGPKNIILVVDTSYSMKGDRLKVLKEATTRIIETLAYGDRVAIVAFNDTAHLIADQRNDKSYIMFEATTINKKKTLQAVEQLSAGGRTNFIDALNATFQIVQNTIDGEFIGTSCNTAILFFTDGIMNTPVGITETTLKQFVSSRFTELSKNGTNRIFFFTYSLSSETGAHRLPKELACLSENGVWSKIDNNNDIVDSLNSYYRLFALGLGKENVKAWVEPYAYSTGGVLGTTVSIPVYDNSRDPAIFIGVIGIDLPLRAIGKTSDNKTSSEILADAVGAGTCPEVNLTVCLLESYRRLNGGTTCNASCSEADFVDIEAANCSFLEKFPNDPWSNRNSSGKVYEVSFGHNVVNYVLGFPVNFDTHYYFTSKERACCISGQTISTFSSCPAVHTTTGSPASGSAPISMATLTGNSSKIKGGAIAGIVLGAVALIAVIFAFRMKKRGQQQLQQGNNDPAPEPSCSPSINLPIVEPIVTLPSKIPGKLSHDMGEQSIENDIFPRKSIQPQPPPSISGLLPSLSQEPNSQ